MVHIPADFQNPVQDAIGSFGFVGVTLFFMVSAYGMQLSAEHKPAYLKHFWRNRLLALLVPCLLINLCVYFINWIVHGSASLNVLWKINNYVVVLLGYCLWFYVVMFCKEKLAISQTWITDALLAGGVVVSSLCSYAYAGGGEVSAAMGWCYERYGLVWGLVFYRFMPSVKRWLSDKRLLKAVIFLLVSLSLGVLYLRYKTLYFYGEYLLKVVLGVVIIMWMLLVTVKRQFGNKMSLYLGDISYEVYLSHGFVMAALAVLAPGISSGVFILLTYVITILFSAVVSMAAKKIVAYFRA